MTTLKDNITEAVKTAMKARELEKVKVLRNIQAVLKQKEIDEQITLNDTNVLEILQKQIKQRQESLTIYQNNHREDLAQKEQFELDVIQTFMPKAMSDEEILTFIDAEIAKQGATSMRDMGKVMGAVKAQTIGRADPALISKLIKSRLA